MTQSKIVDLAHMGHVARCDKAVFPIGDKTNIDMLSRNINGRNCSGYMLVPLRPILYCSSASVSSGDSSLIPRPLNLGPGYETIAQKVN